MALNGATLRVNNMNSAVETVTEHFYPSQAEMLEALTAYCQQALDQACADNNEASFLVSGGSSPAPLYQRLAKLDLPWQKISVALVDERWVDKDHEASNHAFIEKTLLQDKAAACRFIPMKTAAASAQAGLDEASANYHELPQPWDLTILGMGKDGHTASLFPDAQGLEQALKIGENLETQATLAAITANPSEVTGDNLERITLSLAGLLQSRQLILLISGDEKLAVYRQAQTLADSHKMPVGAVLKQDKVPVHVFWAP
ncbi:MAG: 6-phosphogluconolactonase [Alteromonadaceae bacterium]|jgi:6-phosphogluconolactonase